MASIYLKGYIEIDGDVVDSDTTDNNGEISFSFQDYGEQQNIGIATVKALFQHPSINSSVVDSSTISIVCENNFPCFTQFNDFGNRTQRLHRLTSQKVTNKPICVMPISVMFSAL